MNLCWADNSQVCEKGRRNSSQMKSTDISCTLQTQCWTSKLCLQDSVLVTKSPYNLVKETRHWHMKVNSSKIQMIVQNSNKRKSGSVIGLSIYVSGHRYGEVQAGDLSLRQALAANLGRGVWVIMIMSIPCSFIPGGEKPVWPVAILSVSRSWFVFLIYSMKWFSLMACHWRNAP